MTGRRLASLLVAGALLHQVVRRVVARRRERLFYEGYTAGVEDVTGSASPDRVMPR